MCAPSGNRTHACWNDNKTSNRMVEVQRLLGINVSRRPPVFGEKSQSYYLFFLQTLAECAGIFFCMPKTTLNLAGIFTPILFQPMGFCSLISPKNYTRLPQSRRVKSPELIPATPPPPTNPAVNCQPHTSTDRSCSAARSTPITSAAVARGQGRKGRPGGGAGFSPLFIYLFIHIKYLLLYLFLLIQYFYLFYLFLFVYFLFIIFLPCEDLKISFWQNFRQPSKNENPQPR